MSVDDTLVSNKDASEEKENVQPSDVTKAHGITAAVKSKIIGLATFQTVINRMKWNSMQFWERKEDVFFFSFVKLQYFFSCG